MPWSMPLSAFIEISQPEPPPLFCYRLDLGHGTGERSGTRDKDHPEQQEKRSILCRFCSSAVTSQAAAINKNGRHDHVFFNPAGIAFEVSCFREAPGCVIQGKATTTFSWFSGYAWQYALCANCLTHLGWRFTSKKDTFFALISTRLLS